MIKEVGHTGRREVRGCWLPGERGEAVDNLRENLRECEASDRKLRLFAVACCRRIWDLLSDERSRQAVEVAERFAEGQATYEELTEADRAAGEARSAARRAARQSQTPAAEAAAYAAWCAEAAAHGSITDAAEAARAAAGVGEEAVAQSRLLHCIFGPKPFQPLPTPDPSWLASNGRAVERMAATIYAQRRFEDLPVLADALEESGCTDEAFLGHCRASGPHTLGCWVIDALLGKG